MILESIDFKNTSYYKLYNQYLKYDLPKFE